jgi:DNA-binding transcriptional LysR family regulator
MMDLHYLKLFNTLATELSFSKAADALFISQPAVSMQIKKFEAELGFKLFDRVGKSLQLNENGKILYGYSKHIFELLDEAEFELSSHKTLVGGIVNIGASNTPGTYILPKIIGEFVELHPQVNINLHIANTYEIENLILDNKLDFAVNGGVPPVNSNIYWENLLYDEVLLVASASSKLVEGGPIECMDLASARFVAHEENSQMYKMVESIIAELGLEKNIFMTLGNIDAVKQAVLVDLGITAIPQSAIASELYFGQLKEIKLRNRSQSWRYPYNLIYRKNKHITIAAQKLIELIRLRMT